MEQPTNDPDGGASDVERVVRPRRGLYLCKKTSVRGATKPCDEAFQVTVINTDTRNCDDPKKIPVNKGTNGDWYERGTNHRTENGNIKRDLGTITEWAVELDDVMIFVDKYGDCVVSRNNSGFATIEVYDDYRE